MDLPRYPATASEELRDESLARRASSVLLALEAIALGLSLPIQLLMLLSLGWEGGDEAMKHRMVELLPLLGMGALLAAVLSAVAASSVWRDGSEATSLVASVAALVALLGLGWAAGLRDDLVDPLLGFLWVLLTAPGPVALLLVLVVRRRAAVRR